MTKPHDYKIKPSPAFAEKAMKHAIEDGQSAYTIDTARSVIDNAQHHEGDREFGRQRYWGYFEGDAHQYCVVTSLTASAAASGNVTFQKAITIHRERRSKT